jgi:CheY-like chemotaxis protein
METTRTEDSGGQRPSAISALIEQMLDRHGVGERQRVRLLETVLRMSYQQARRRMVGEAPWSIEELKRLADHFHEPLIPLVAAFLHQPGKPASFPVAGAVLPCTVWPVGEPIAGRIGPLVVLHDKVTDQWTVLPSAQATDRPSYELSVLLFERPAPRRVAVLDDDLELAHSIVDFLAAKGIDAHPFCNAEELLAAMEAEHFDGFIIDWLLGSATALELLAQIRARQPAGPLIILTGQITTGFAKEDELTLAGATYRALVLEKPMRLLTILNALQVGFGSPEDA